MSELFGISLDELVKGAITVSEIEDRPSEVSVQTSPQGSPAIIAKQSNTRIIIGALMIAVGSIGFMFFGTYALPLIFAGIGCLAVKSHPVLASVWGLFFGLDLFWRTANGNHWRTIRATSYWTQSMNYTILYFSWGLFIAALILIIITSFRLGLRPQQETDKRPDALRITVTVLLLAIAIILLFFFTFGSIIPREQYITDLMAGSEHAYRLQRLSIILTWVSDSIAVILISTQLGKVIRWIKPLK